MNVLVTGGLGQIGSHVSEMLLARGDRVVVIDNLATGQRHHLADHPQLTVVIDTIANRDKVRELCAAHKFDAIVHTAASYKDPTDWYNDTLTNCVGGTNLIQAAQEFGVKRFIYFQTALCYGVKPLQQPIRLDHPKFPANSSYAISKTVCEDYLEISGVDYVSFRLANVIGPRNVSGPLPIFFQRLSEGKKCFVTKARRDFVFNQDLARAVLKAVDEGWQSFGPSRVTLGPSAVVRVEGTEVDVILNTNRTQTFEPDIFSNIGIDPLGKDVLLVKSTNHFYAGFAPIAAEIIYVTAPSSYPSNPAVTDYRKLTRPIWPRVADPWR